RRQLLLDAGDQGGTGPGASDGGLRLAPSDQAAFRLDAGERRVERGRTAAYVGVLLLRRVRNMHPGGCDGSDLHAFPPSGRWSSAPLPSRDCVTARHGPEGPCSHTTAFWRAGDVRAYTSADIAIRTEAPMAVAALSTAGRAVRDRVSPEEWETRVNLAALYRLVAKHGMTDLTATHIS